MYTYLCVRIEEGINVLLKYTYVYGTFFNVQLSDLNSIQIKEYY